MENNHTNENEKQLTADDINQVYQDALRDPSLLSSMNVDELLDSLETSKNDYLENKTLNSITNDIYNSICEVCRDPEEQQKLCLKLVGYRVVDELHELHKGKHVRWINRKSPTLATGGFVVSIKFMEHGTNILCRNTAKQFIQYKFDECITFQKLSPTESLILMLYEHATHMS